MKQKKCKICKKRNANSQHAKDYNHDNINGPDNRARLCKFCHLAFHQLNNKNNLDWDWMMENKREEIIKKADKLEHNSLRNKGGVNSFEFSKALPELNTREVK